MKSIHKKIGGASLWFTPLEARLKRPAHFMQNIIGSSQFLNKQRKRILAKILFRPKLLTGFTIIELLVVVAIIALIASLVLVQTQSARARERDTHREQDIKTLQNALTLYAVNNRTYPVYSGVLTGTDPVSLELKAKDTLTQIPLDPQNVSPYQYVYNSTDGITYTLAYYLETGSITGKSAGQQTAGP